MMWMTPAFLLPEMTIDQNGAGPAMEVTGTGVGNKRTGSLVLLTLGVGQIREQQSLVVAIEGSADGLTWNSEPVVVFPQKFYSGLSSVLVDLKRHAGMRFLRATWKVDRWGRGDKTPSFRVYLAAEGLDVEAATGD
ncbi:MAG TPA: hypothetical protein VH351_09010 [Bryobacteraceae bacterium]|jgi:hypothetical protein|nr:hypothetical protein [Bryobacteraceae bacterium]